MMLDVAAQGQGSGGGARVTSDGADPGTWEPIVGAIGPKVREVRQHLGLSLQQLAARSDVSAAAIHKVERGDMVPTITTLLKLSGALGRPIGHFVDDGAPAAPVAVHVRAADRPHPPLGWVPAARGVAAAGIAGPSDRMRAGAVVIVVEPGGDSGDTGPMRPGEQVVLLLEGTLAVDVAGEHHLLDAGDALHYPTDRPHSWHNPGPAPARAVWFLVHG